MKASPTPPATSTTGSGMPILRASELSATPTITSRTMASATPVAPADIAVRLVGLLR